MSFEEKITLVQALVTLLVAAGEMTQAELADRIGMTRQSVIAIEKGRYAPSLEIAFARVFGIPFEQVVQDRLEQDQEEHE